MSDPLSISGSAAGLISLGLVSTKILYKFYEDYRDRKDNLTNIVGNLEKLEAILEFLKRTTKDSDIVSHDEESRRLIESCVQDCKQHMKKLHEESQKFGSKPKNDLPVAQPTGKNFVGRRRRFGGAVQVVFRPLAQNILIQRDTHYTRGVVDNSELRDWLKAPNVSDNLNWALERSTDGTGDWFVDSDEFSTWFANQHSLLWLKGFSGCGKTFLCSTAIDHLLRHRESRQKIGVAFFFFTFNDQSKQDASAMLRALVLQLSSQLGSFQHIKKLHDKYGDSVPSNQDLETCLHELVASFDNVYIILDALDECPKERHRRIMLESVTRIYARSGDRLHMLVTSLEETDISGALGGIIDVQTLRVYNSTNRDIANHISKMLRRSSLKKWENHRPRIEYELTNQSNGSFRLVACQLEELEKSAPTLEALERLLTSLPKDLDEAYRRLLTKINEPDREYAQQMLTFLCYAEIPLTVPELVDAMAVKYVTPMVFDPKRKLPGTSASIRELCPVLVDAEERCFGPPIARIAHSSVKRFLESERIREYDDVKEFALISSYAHTRIVRTCLVFLETPRPESHLYDNPITRYAVVYWKDHMREGRKTSELRAQILQLLQNDTAFNHMAKSNIFRHTLFGVVTKHRSALFRASFLGITPIVEELLREVSSFNDEYGAAIKAASVSGHRNIVQLLIEKGPESADSKALEKNPNLDVSTAFRRACRWGSSGLVGFFLKCKNVDINAYGKWEGTPLMLALNCGHDDVSRLLLLEPSIDINLRTKNGRTALHIATKKNLKEMVGLLLTKAANIDARDNEGNTALMMALGRGLSEMAGLLIRNGANARIRNRHGKQALHVAAQAGLIDIFQLLFNNVVKVDEHNYYEVIFLDACRGGREDIVRLLTSRNIDFGTKTTEGETALHLASKSRNKCLLSVLLSKGIDINAQDNHGTTALHLASQHISGYIYVGLSGLESHDSNESIVRFLLDEGADATIRDEDGRTALWHACDLPVEYGGYDVAKLLLDRQADVINVQCNNGNTPLHKACEYYGHVVRLFLERGADIEIKNGEGKTAIWIAVEGYSSEAVSLLLEAGASTDIRDERGGTLLHIACSGWNGKRLQLLLEKGIGIDIQDRLGQTALILAAFQGREKHIQLLLEKGADVNIQDCLGNTALHKASKEGYDAIVRMLIVEKGAKIPPIDVL
ncbi:ankyrin repeat-containing domain protein [Hypoxylon trugodes]|uniref:ankyrin repeat-containing domain protein n=1 Tax=Hypoxylon trugodes TaxID=326681 RepID=UPI0021976955|nr:ankyrin repeat-containing domain protein [Hypoxylon trugodes]KAI1387790.1 ankyrin repeat-containing domain protein [Hypoxylon trugodes]